jgi:hypothetical protein
MSLSSISAGDEERLYCYCNSFPVMIIMSGRLLLPALPQQCYLFLHTQFLQFFYVIIGIIIDKVSMAEILMSY